MRSPWAKLQGVERVVLYPPPGPVVAELRVPGSKSATNRALLLAGFAKGPSTLSGILKSDDAYWATEALRALGIGVRVEGETAWVEGGGPKKREAEVFVGSAGTLARFLTAMLAFTPGRWALQASPQMQRRPIAPLLDALKTLGVGVSYLEEEGRFPFVLEGRKVPGGEVRISGATSSQFVSALLLAGALSEGPLFVRVEGGIVQPDYVRITARMMETFGARVREEKEGFRILPTGYRGRDVELEADASSAAYFFALAAASGGRVRVLNLGSDTLQPDLGFVDVLARMGAEVEKTKAATAVKGPKKLEGGFRQSLLRMSDQTPTLAALAAFADAPIEIREVAHVRHHETDRIAVMAEELKKAGIRVEEFRDGLRVHPGRPKPALLDSHDDHRVAMSLSLLSLSAPGLSIRDPGAVSKTFPDYFDRLRELGFRVEVYTQGP